MGPQCAGTTGERQPGTTWAFWVQHCGHMPHSCTQFAEGFAPGDVKTPDTGGGAAATVTA